MTGERTGQGRRGDEYNQPLMLLLEEKRLFWRMLRRNEKNCWVERGQMSGGQGWQMEDRKASNTEIAQGSHARNWGI